MKYIELTEDISSCISNETFNQMFVDKCSLFVRSNTRLYRGVWYNNEDEPNYIRQCEFGIGNIRQDRRPKDSTKFEKEVFDKLMELKGWPFRKHNTLSVSVNKDQAERFGKVHQIFPYDGSTYLYTTHPGFKDFLAIVSEFRRMAYYDKQENQGVGFAELRKIPASDLVNEYGEEFFKKHPVFYTTNVPYMLRTAIGEVLVHGNSYLVKGLQ